ncbi:ABC transporter permease [Faunimonas sp. B44]|uniref:ABC transporter permease n=1 Tax=Faunimonas sp. B44 TaxID=3461493 RepID=UPI0040443796
MWRAAETGLRIGAVAALLLLWEAAVRLLSVPAFVLPPPSRIAAAFAAEPGYFLAHASTTGWEIVAGMAIGVGLGAASAVLLALSPRLERLVGPMLVVSQALPVFAIAPLLVIWFGFGLASKVAMAGLIIFFPVATAFADGLRRTDPDLLDLARLNGAGRIATLWKLRIPAALPALGSGLRIAAGVAPIGAVVGEWVGASAGLGFIMLQANARMQTDRVFVALVLLAVMAILLRAAVDGLVRRQLAWVPGEGSNR